MENPYEVIARFNCILSDSPLNVAKKIAKYLKESADEVTFDVINEQDNSAVTVDLSEYDEDAVLPNKEIKEIKAYQLHDSETEEILGTIFILRAGENASDEIFDGWESFNKLEEHEKDSQSVLEFVEWFNENYVTQIGFINMDFVQL